VFGKDRGTGTALLEEGNSVQDKDINDADKMSPSLPTISEEGVPKDATKDWLGYSKRQARHLRKESTELGVRIERELEHRGYGGPSLS
jgi:hypothetical protein